EVERMRRLKSRERMLVDELDLPAALEHETELVEPSDIALEHHAVDEEQGHAFRVARRCRQEQVLKRGLRAIRWRFSRNEVGRRLRRHDRRNRVLIDELRSTFAAKEQRESVEPGDHPLKLDPFDEEDRDRQLRASDAVQEVILQT